MSSDDELIKVLDMYEEVLGEQKKLNALLKEGSLGIMTSRVFLDRTECVDLNSKMIASIESEPTLFIKGKKKGKLSVDADKPKGLHRASRAANTPQCLVNTQEVFIKAIEQSIKLANMRATLLDSANSFSKNKPDSD